MADHLNRRGFLKNTLAVSAGVGLAHSFEEQALLAYAADGAATATPSADGAAPFPTGTIGNMTLSRIICGGNLISGYAHSRDLIYVSPLLEHYFTDEKVFETFRICEANGIDAAMLKFDEKTRRIVGKYWHEFGGNIQWIAQIVTPDSMKEDIRVAADNGAAGIFTTGQMGDELVRQGRVNLLAEAVSYARDNGVIAGVSCHELAVIRACEDARVNPDFYMKTFNEKNYWSARPSEKCDNVFNDESPQETIDLMRGIEKPWVAFKVLGAGAIEPRAGFEFAFANGADFLCVGMFDFQVAEDAAIARDIIAKAQARPRPWRA